MARASMAQLIAQARSLLGNVSPAIFTDDQIQDRLDVYRTERRWVPLRPVQTFTPGGAITYNDYYSDAEYWEADVLLQDTGYTTITADSSELLTGHWHFNMQPAGIAVRATGKTYDVYAAAADLAEMWAAQVVLEFDFSTSRDQFKRSQKFDQLTKLAAQYRARAMVHVSRLVQTDAAPDVDGSGVTYPSVQGDGFSYGP